MKKQPSRKKTTRDIARKPADVKHEDALYHRVVEIIESARRHVARAVDTTMVQAYWLVGCEIVEAEQHGKARVGYGEGVIDRLSVRLQARLGKGFGPRTLRVSASLPDVSEGLGSAAGAPGAEESDRSSVQIGRIEAFLLELGRLLLRRATKRLTLDGDHFYVDLVFYNRLLHCFVLVDLKLTHQDLGQMQMYVHYFDRFQRVEHEAKTIGIVLCSDKNDTMAKITLPEDNEQILAARYQLYLPTEEELRAELAREREDVECAQRLAALTENSDENAESAAATALP